MTGFFKKDRPRRKLRKLIKEKKLDEALAFGHSIEKKYENDPDIDFIIGTIYFLQGDSKKTLSYMDKVLGSKNVDEKYAAEIEPIKNSLRLKYVKEKNFLLDIRILIETVFSIMGIKNITRLNIKP